MRYFTSQLIGRYINGVEIDTKKKLIAIDDEHTKEVNILKELTWTYVIEAPSLALQREGQRTIIDRLFAVYLRAANAEENWSIFPSYYREELQDAANATERKRIVVDLIAGMTEPQAVEAYKQSLGAWPGLLQQVIR